MEEVVRGEEMIDNKKSRGINKKKITVLGFLLLLTFIFLFIYNASTTYFGFIEIRELEQVNNEFIVIVEGDFGVEKSIFNQNDYFRIVENGESREGHIAEIWDNLSENEAFHVLLKSYDNRNKFDLERIYIDKESNWML